MIVLGVSGSPINNSNTDRALKLALESTGLETEFIKLADYTVEPCRACLGCRKTNRCVIKDDGIALAEKAKEADALIIAGFTPYSSLDARTKAFMERLYPLRHQHGYMAGKPAGAIITYCIPADNEMFPPASQSGIDAIKYFLMEEAMDFVGDVRVLGNIPCLRCEDADECKTSGIKMLQGPNATISYVKVGTFEDQPEIVAAAIKLGEDIAAKLKT